MNAREEYEMEQVKKQVSESCYQSATEFWNKAKKVFGEDKDKAPYIYSTIDEGGGVEFTFSQGENGEVECVLDRSTAGSGQEVVILPIQLQEWYYREPRYSDEYVRYQLGKRLEEFVLGYITRDSVAVL